MTNNPTTTTIDLTPTWFGILPTLIAVIENGKPEGRKEAIVQLQKLAAYADDCNSRRKELASRRKELASTKTSSHHAVLILNIPNYLSTPETLADGIVRDISKRWNIEAYLEEVFEAEDESPA
jgi:hypothetical protein